MKIKFILFILFIFSILFSIENESLFNPIRSSLQRYRHTIEEKDFDIENGIIYLELNGRRTNQKSLFLLGFHSIGRQLQKGIFNFKEVQIIIHYEMKNTQQITAKASMKTVLALSQGRLSQEQFFNEIAY